MAKFKFQGTIRSGFDGENCAGEGTLTVDGAERKVVFGAAAPYAEIAWDGSSTFEEMATELADWFAEVWPEQDDPLWKEDPKDDAWKEAEVSF
jgi:hypothetical protein